MGNVTKIEWTERTWNPIVGCSLASPGCTNCYAMRAAYRMSKNPKTPQYYDSARLVNGKPVFTGRLTLAEKALTEPLKRRKPTDYFVNSMGDLFHENMPDEWIDRVFAVMALCPQHTFKILTKRADRMREYVENAERRVFDEVCDQAIDQRLEVALSAQPEHDERAACFGRPVVRLYQWPLPNVWLGVSVEDQRRADERVPQLLATPAAIRFISAEPLLGPVDLTGFTTFNPRAMNWPDETEPEWPMGNYNPLEGSWWPAMGDPEQEYALREEDLPSIGQVIVGGESGPNARPMHPDWARSLRDQCQAAGTAFFFKQWGEWHPESWVHYHTPFGSDCGAFTKDGRFVHSRDKLTPTHNLEMRRVGKKAAGRILDGREWNETPKSKTTEDH